MKIMQRIRALFNHEGKEEELDVRSAEIRPGKVFLHPAGGPDKVITVHSDDVEIIIHNRDDQKVMVREPDEHPKEKGTRDLEKLPKPPVDPDDILGKKKKKPGKERPLTDIDLIKMRSFSMKMKDDWHSELSTACKESGASRAEFIMACVRAASPSKVRAELKKMKKE